MVASNSVFIETSDVYSAQLPTQHVDNMNIPEHYIHESQNATNTSEMHDVQTTSQGIPIVRHIYIV
jgi:hypothetical protein